MAVGHVSKTENDDRRQIPEPRSDRVDFICGPKEKRPVDPEDRHVGRNLLVLQDVRVSFAETFLGHARYGCRGRHLANEH